MANVALRKTNAHLFARREASARLIIMLFTTAKAEVLATEKEGCEREGLNQSFFEIAYQFLYFTQAAFGQFHVLQSLCQNTSLDRRVGLLDFWIDRAAE